MQYLLHISHGDTSFALSHQSEWSVRINDKEIKQLIDDMYSQFAYILPIIDGHVQKDVIQLRTYCSYVLFMILASKWYENCLWPVQNYMYGGMLTHWPQGKYGCNLKLVICNLIWRIGMLSPSYEVALRWMPKEITND